MSDKVELRTVRRIALFAGSIALALVSSSVIAKTTAEEVAEIRAEIKSNSVSRTTDCQYYRAWYRDLCTKEEHAAILERNIAAHRRWIELEPKNPSPYAELGKVLAAVGRWDEAEAELRTALQLDNKRKLHPVLRAEATYEMANCLWKKGDRAEAKRRIKDIGAMTYSGDGTQILKDKVKYLSTAFFDPDSDIDMFTLPHSRDGKPFPTPQEAKYGAKKVSLAKVELKLGTNGTDETDGTSSAGRISPVGSDYPIVRLLKRKLTRFGTKFEKGGTPVFIELSPSAPVDKPQSYSIDVAKGKVVVKARTRLGLAYGIVSLLQCVVRGDESDGPNVCEMAIRDWPKLERRGAIPGVFHPEFLEYALFSKMSSVTMTMGRCQWTLSPLEREMFHIFGQRFRDFGVQLYCNIRALCLRPLLPLASPRTWKLHLSWMRFLASVGIDGSFHLDDERFPLPPSDIEKEGCGANLDAKYLTRLYRETKKDYPDFKMQFCPPFYWGPDSPANYPEPREPYLKSLGEFLDPEIDVYWTGGSVGSWSFTEKKVKWFADLIGRKPTVFHNGNCIGKHNWINYGADEAGYKKSHEPGVLSQFASFQSNMSSYDQSPEVYAAMDWCWNPEAHDAAVAARRIDEQLEGPGVYEVLKEATPALEYFDKYRYGEARSELFTEDQANLDRRVAVSDAAWSNVLALAANGGRFVNGFNRGRSWAKRLADDLRNPPEWLLEKHKALMENTRFAEKEVGYDASEGDIFIPAELLSGGRYYTGIGDWSESGKRNVKYIQAGSSVEAKFECSPFPPSRPLKLMFVGMDWNGNKAAGEVEVNGRVVWKGLPFPTLHYFKPLEVEVPVDALERYSHFVFRTAVPPEQNDKKVIMHYVVIRK